MIRSHQQSFDESDWGGRLGSMWHGHRPIDKVLRTAGARMFGVGYGAGQWRRGILLPVGHNYVGHNYTGQWRRRILLPIGAGARLLRPVQALCRSQRRSLARLSRDCNHLRPLIHMSMRMSIRKAMRVSIHMSVYMSIDTSIRMSIHMSIHLSLVSALECTPAAALGFGNLSLRCVVLVCCLVGANG